MEPTTNAWGGSAARRARRASSRDRSERSGRTGAFAPGAKVPLRTTRATGRDSRRASATARSRAAVAPAGSEGSISFGTRSEVDETGTARREEVPGGEGDGAALVRGDHVAESARRIGGARGEFGAEGLQQRIGNAGEEVDAETAAVFEKRGRIDHGVKRA